MSLSNYHVEILHYYYLQELENQKNVNGAAGNDIPQQPDVGVENRAAPTFPDEIKSIKDSQLVVQKQIQPPKIHFEDNKGPLVNANVPIDAPAVPKNDLGINNLQHFCWVNEDIDRVT